MSALWPDAVALLPISAEATIWWLRLDDVAAPQAEAVLSPDERDRATRFRFERDRRLFVTARGVLRTLLGHYLRADPKQIELAYGNHGKPRLADDEVGLRFNVSHSDDLVALAFCERREVGVDVERVRPCLFTEEIARRYLPPPTVREIERHSGEGRVREFFRAWVRLEAHLKGRGDGLRELGSGAHPEGWSVIDLSPLDGYAGAVAIESGAPVRVSTRRVCLETQALSASQTAQGEFVPTVKGDS